MNRSPQPWQKLIALARQAGDARETVAPHGFATRVVAQATGLPTDSLWAGLERLAWRGLLAATALSIAAIAFNYTNHSGEPVDDYLATETMTELLGLS